MTNELGLQARIALGAILWALRPENGGDIKAFPDEKDFPSMEGMSAGQLISLVERATALLKEKGIDGVPRDGIAPKKLFITRDYRIFLDPEGKREVELPPSMKAVFLLYLKHPEGIPFPQLSLHRKDLEKSYRETSSLADMETMSKVLDRILTPGTRRVNVIATNLSHILSTYLDASELGQYLIKGSYGKDKGISLDRGLVEWDFELTVPVRQKGVKPY